MKIAVIGPQNTGKSTFINDFLNKFDSYKTPEENYRDLVNRKGLSINQKTTEESQRLIRDFIYEQLLNNKEDRIIFDRCIIDNYIYTLAQVEKGLIREGFLKETENMMYASLSYIDSLIFIPTSASVQIVDDNFRDTDTMFIDYINKMFIETLLDISSKNPIKIITITGDRDSRIQEITSKLNL